MFYIIYRRLAVVAIHEKINFSKPQLKCRFGFYMLQLGRKQNKNTRGVAGTTKTVSRRRGLGRQFQMRASYLKIYQMLPDSVENPFYSTSGFFKPISGLCRSH